MVFALSQAATLPEVWLVCWGIRCAVCSGLVYVALEHLEKSPGLGFGHASYGAFPEVSSRVVEVVVRSFANSRDLGGARVVANGLAVLLESIHEPKVVLPEDRVGP